MVLVSEVWEQIVERCWWIRSLLQSVVSPPAMYGEVCLVLADTRVPLCLWELAVRRWEGWSLEDKTRQSVWGLGRPQQILIIMVLRPTPSP